MLLGILSTAHLSLEVLMSVERLHGDPLRRLLLQRRHFLPLQLLLRPLNPRGGVGERPPGRSHARAETKNSIHWSFIILIIVITLLIVMMFVQRRMRTPNNVLANHALNKHCTMLEVEEVGGNGIRDLAEHPTTFWQITLLINTARCLK